VTGRVRDNRPLLSQDHGLGLSLGGRLPGVSVSTHERMLPRVGRVEYHRPVVYNDMKTREVSRRQGADHLANQTGKRYVCAQCGAEFIVTKGGEGAISCCKQVMEIKR
jgi:DNA-directed RNA polymerase subunit RPC12/RpoP